MYLDMAQVAKRFNVSTMTIRRHVAAGIFPLPLRLGRLLRWRESDLLAWEQQQISKNQIQPGQEPQEALQ